MELSSDTRGEEENKDPMNIEGEEKEEAMNIEGEEKEDAMMEEKQEAMMIEEKQEAPIMFLRSVIDKYKYRVEEEVALQIPIIRARFKIYNTKMKDKKKPEKKIFYNIWGGVTKGSLEIVVKYMYNLLYPSQHAFDFEAEFLKLEPVSILNLIIAANYLRIKNLMDLTCKRLADKVMTDVRTKEIYSKRKMVLQKDANPRKTLKRTDNMSPSGPQDSDKDCSTDMLLGGPQDSGKDCSPYEQGLLRVGPIHNFVNESYFLDVHLSPMVQLSSVGHRSCPLVRRLETTFNEHLVEAMKLNLSVNSGQLTIAILRLEEIIVGDPRFSSCLREHVIFYLAKFLNIDACVEIQCAVVSILSHANLDLCGDIMEDDIFPLLEKKLVLESTGKLFHAVVSALTRLAYMFPDRIEVIVGDKAFTGLYTDFCKGGPNMYCLSKFLAAICRGYCLSSHGFPSDKVKTVLTILEDYEVSVTTNEDIHVFVCYALLHLSYRSTVALETTTWNKLIERLIDLVYAFEYGSKKVMIIGSALGVIGNFIKWGSEEHIKSSITEGNLLKSLYRVLCSELRKFQIEGSRIISNLAARRTILDEIVSSGVVGCLCKLLENENFEVKVEAALAVINSIYGCAYRRKIEKCLEMEQAK